MAIGTLPARVSGSIQLGAIRVVFEGQSDRGGTMCRVEAPVLDYWGLKAREGAIWTITKGTAPGGESRESIEERCFAVYGRGYGIIGYQGSRAGYPYQERT